MASVVSKKLVLTLSTLVVALLGVIGLLAWKYADLKKNPDALAQEKTQQLVEEVSKLYDLPKGEHPTIAQVQDKDKLKDQAFFDKAKNGDYILVYTTDKLAVLYRQTEKKLINVGPINIQSEQDTPSSSQTPKNP